MRLLLAATLSGCLATTPTAAAPVLNLVEPRGGQRGTEVEVHFHGARLEAGTTALFYQNGLTLGPVEWKAQDHVVAKLTIAPDAPLGEHSLRLLSPSGITELRSFWVGQFQIVNETEPNNSFDQPQRIELNTTVHGVATAEDEDIFVCTLRKGQRLSVEVEAMRLGRILFDASIAILDPRKFELATCDDIPLLRTDACASIIAPEDGDYRIVVREAAYEGRAECQYRLHIGTFPRPTAVFPPGGKPGETLEFTFIGDPTGPFVQPLTLPSTPSATHPLFPLQGPLCAPSPHLVCVSPLDHAREFPPNANIASATPLPNIPCAAHGILDGSQSRDWFKFNATKGSNLTLRVLARSLRSPLDPVLTLTDSSGKSIASNDDQGGPDSQLAWTCPADGTYGLMVRDQLSRTGPDFIYRIEVTPRSPAITASLPTVERVNTQKWKTFPVPRGNRYAAVVNVNRENTNCEATFKAAALPQGVTLHAPAITRAMNSFPIVLEASPDAPTSGGLYTFSLESTGTEPAITGNLTDTIHHIDINNQGAYHSVSLDRIPTAVTTEAPFRIDLQTPAGPLVRNGTLLLNIRANRSEGYQEKITLRMLWTPPGVKGPVTVEIPGNQTEATYELNASGDAATGQWPLCVLAEANTPQGPTLTSSALTPLTVAEPFVTAAIDLAATEQGRPTPVLAKLSLLRDFEGEATAELLGLPHGTQTTPVTFTKDQTELTFPLQVAADAAIGKHASLFCRILIPDKGTQICHLTGQGGTLRIDSPPPATPAQAAKNPTSPPPDQPTATPQKPLSRLEQLRQKGK